MNVLTEKDRYRRNDCLRNLINTKYAAHAEDLMTGADEQAVERFRQVVDQMDDKTLLNLTAEQFVKLAVEHGVALFQAYGVMHRKL